MMSLYDWRWSERLLRDFDGDPSFFGLIFCLLRKTSGEYQRAMAAIWPFEVSECLVRYHMPKGLLTEEEFGQFFEEAYGRREVCELTEAENPEASKKESFDAWLADFHCRLVEAVRRAKSTAIANGWELHPEIVSLCEEGVSDGSRS